MPWLKERSSCQMFFKNVGQMIQLHTPNPNKNQATGRETIIASVSPPRGGTLPAPVGLATTDDRACPVDHDDVDGHGRITQRLLAHQASSRGDQITDRHAGGLADLQDVQG